MVVGEEEVVETSVVFVRSVEDVMKSVVVEEVVVVGRSVVVVVGVTSVVVVSTSVVVVVVVVVVVTPKVDVVLWACVEVIPSVVEVEFEPESRRHTCLISKQLLTIPEVGAIRNEEGIKIIFPGNATEKSVTHTAFRKRASHGTSRSLRPPPQSQADPPQQDPP